MINPKFNLPQIGGIRKAKLILPAQMGVSDFEIPPELHVNEPYQGSDNKHIVAMVFVIDGVEHFIPLTVRTAGIFKTGLEISEKYPIHRPTIEDNNGKTKPN